MWWPAAGPWANSLKGNPNVVALSSIGAHLTEGAGIVRLRLKQLFRKQFSADSMRAKILD
jgi:hypothetical protein